ncbi:hypothetical protein HFC70_13875 [Agrobacterium sp. a22-2]|uniref:hypothetical protein n=1 Tax=Agrobacterium sp. a22-2 TaxID=2283840 RepID=UPI001444DC44|nr:hypothetical protein [Agrobacterium sp. a22-2]NKN37441.1 hypothetical protein [Agrobacterium sp. a22-2]
MGFTLTTFGTCRLEDDIGQVLRVPLVALVLLAYLYDKGQPISRRELASLFWQGSRETAHTNLRSTLHRLALAIPQTLPSLIEANGQALSINRTSVRCDLSLVDLVDPMDRLRAANDAVAMQFLPSMGNGTTPLDGWIRDVRNRLAGHLRSEFIRHHASFDASALRAELRRAAVLLLEHDPADEEVRALLTARLDAKRSQKPAGRVGAHVVPLQPQPMKGQDGSLVEPSPLRLALLPPETVQSARREGSVANALIEDLTISLCASRAVSIVAPYTAERIQASKDKAAILQKYNVIYALDTKRTEDCLFVQLIFMPADEVVWATRFKLDAQTIAEQRAAISMAIQRSIIERITASAEFAGDFHHRPKAYFAYLEGLKGLSTLTLPSIRKARRCFKQALEDERGFPAALAGMSRTLSIEWLLTARGDNELLLHAERLAQAAIRQHGPSASAFKELGVSQLYLGKIDDSLNALSEAEAISPHYADALYSHADSLVHASNPAAALAKITSAIALNPMPPDTYFWTAAGASYFLGEYRQALSYIDRMRDSRPASRLAAACWGMLGEAVKARACRLRVLKDNPNFDLDLWLRMIPHKEYWQTELYREGLVRAGF